MRVLVLLALFLVCTVAQLGEDILEEEVDHALSAFDIDDSEEKKVQSTAQQTKEPEVRSENEEGEKKKKITNNHTDDTRCFEK